MKRTVSIFAAIIASFALLAGCMGMDNNNTVTPGTNGTNATDKGNLTDNNTENNNGNNNDLTGGITKDPMGENQNHTTGNMTVDTGNFIGEEKAKEEALAKAGITADGVKFEKVDLELDDGVWVYEIDFTKDNHEYDVKVKADDGIILEYEKDRKD